MVQRDSLYLFNICCKSSVIKGFKFFEICIMMNGTVLTFPFYVTNTLQFFIYLGVISGCAPSKHLSQ